MIDYPKTAVLTIMVGPSGAGKTTWCLSGKTDYELSAHELSIHPSHVVSTDAIRTDLTGTHKNLSKDEQVYAAFWAIAHERLRHGLPATLDATHLHQTTRLASASIAPGVRVRYVVIDRPLDEKLANRGWRSEELILKHQERFDREIDSIIKGDGIGVTVFDMRRRV